MSLSCQPAFLLLAETLLLVPNPKEYHWVNQGVMVVENMDDGEELQITDVSGAVWLAHGRESQDRDCGGPACTATRIGVGATPSGRATAQILPWRSLMLQLELLSSLS